jgi:hypothetical protein
MTTATSDDSRRDAAAQSPPTPEQAAAIAEAERLRGNFRNFLCSLGIVSCALMLESADPDARAEIAHFLRMDARTRLDHEVAAAKKLLDEIKVNDPRPRRKAVTRG